MTEKKPLSHRKYQFYNLSETIAASFETSGQIVMQHYFGAWYLQTPLLEKKTSFAVCAAFYFPFLCFGFNARPQ